MTDTEILDTIERSEAWVTCAEVRRGTDGFWRCYVFPVNITSLPRYEIAEHMGYGKTLREAAINCFSKKEP